MPPGDLGQGEVVCASPEVHICCQHTDQRMLLHTAVLSGYCANLLKVTTPSPIFSTRSIVPGSVYVQKLQSSKTYSSC